MHPLLSHWIRSRAGIKPGKPLRTILGIVLLATTFASAARSEDHPDLELNRRNPFGVKTHLTWARFNGLPLYESELVRTQALALMQGIELGWVSYSIAWNAIQSQPGPFDYSFHDPIVDQVRAHGLHSLVTLAWTPAWASSAPGGSDARTKSIHPPRNLFDFYTYVFTTVERYRGRITHWEIWNEPNNQHFFVADGSVLPHPEDYVDLLAVGYQAVKEADPEAIVVLGGLAFNGVRPNPGFPHVTPDWLGRFYAAGGKNYFDLMNIHPYPAPAPAGDHVSQVEETRQLMIENGDGAKRIWVSEVNSNFFPGLNENATDLTTVYVELKRKEYVGKVFWYNFRNKLADFDPRRRDLDSGLVTYDLLPKPSYFEYRDLVSVARERRE